MRILAIAAAVSLHLLPAQQIEARRFLPDDYENVVHVDLQRLRDSGVWDELQTGAAKLMLAALEREAGVPLADLDRVTTVARIPASGPSGREPQPQQVILLEGNAALPMPEHVATGQRYYQDTIGEFEVMRREKPRDEVFAQPAPELQVIGSTALLRGPLEGHPNTGMPCADILSLLSGKGSDLLHIAVHTDNEFLQRRFVGKILPGVEWPADDAIAYVMLELRAIGDPDDPHVHLGVVLRHTKVGDGIEVTEQAARAWLAHVAEQPKLRLAAPLLQRATIRRDRGDLVLKLDLGRARDAGGNIAMIAVPLLGYDAGK
ncbi:MAG: hypothetical protein KDE27_11485 [Planctomycetes bacterium]|nr:hypothetical protein [Planctomycetota bacterium]